jgi:hypothetical protein
VKGNKRMRGAAGLALAAAIALLGGCVYDPYVGALVPCCTYYGYPYAYRYPAPYPYPYSYPYSYAPPAGQSAEYQGQPPAGDTLAQSFAAANVARDGRLTRQQAEAGMPFVAQNFEAIDIDQKGYVTLPEVQAFVARQRAAGWPPGQS